MRINRPTTSRLALAMVVLCFAPVPTYLLYLPTQASDAFDPLFIAQLSVAAVISFAVFSYLHVKIYSRRAVPALGCAGSYLALIATAFVVSAMLGELDETTMWMPIILLFGVPFLAPLIALSYLASLIAFGNQYPAPFSEPMPPESDS